MDVPKAVSQGSVSAVKKEPGSPSALWKSPRKGRLEGSSHLHANEWTQCYHPTEHLKPSTSNKAQGRAGAASTCFAMEKTHQTERRPGNSYTFC